MSDKLRPGWKVIPTGGFIPSQVDMARLETIIGQQATGAIYNGRRVRKVKSKPNDRTHDGTEGTVLGSIESENRGSHLITTAHGVEVVHFGYIILWDDLPDIPVFLTDPRIEEL